MTTGTMTTPARVALVGAHGFGAVHRRNLARLRGAGRAELVAVADPSTLADGEVEPSVRTYADLGALLAAERDLDVVIVSTPLHTHLELAEAVLAAGVDLYLEKPPVTSMAAFERLSAVAARAGRLVQVGFQSLGSHALPRLRAGIAAGEFGEVRAITAAGVWMRDRAYFGRSPWAGRRTLDGVDVVDGVATNALSHAVITALSVAGVRSREQVSEITADLFRANDTESDDTSVIRIRRPGSAPAITCALTIAGPHEGEPSVTVHGSTASATLFYVLDEVRLERDGTTSTERFGRTDLLENLLDARAGVAELLSPLEGTESYMAVLEAVRTAPGPRPIPPAWVDRVGTGPGEHAVVRDIERDVRRACAAEATFTELGLPWAVAGADPAAAQLMLDDTTVASFRTGETLAVSLSPRPYTHPVRTLGGVPLTDAFPLDHPWHLGAGVAIPDVDGSNLWGGPDYSADSGGYRWGRTHGSIRLDTADHRPGARTERLTWLDAAGAPLLDETREWRAEAVDRNTWTLRLRFELTPRRTMTLGSPGAHGRAGAGYGGFFWRLAPACEVVIRTADADSEEAANGSRSPWLRWSAVVAGSPIDLVFRRDEGDDPWFVRAAEYPGVGSALAWEAPLAIAPDRPVSRGFTVHLHDGHLDDAAFDRLLATGERSAGGRRALPK